MSAATMAERAYGWDEVVHHPNESAPRRVTDADIAARVAAICASPPLADITPDLDQARQFLAMLGGDMFTWQVFKDPEAERVGKHGRHWHGPFDETKLARLNRQHFGMFVTINATDGNGRKIENITRVRAVFVDLDADGAAGLAKVRAEGLPPHAIVESSPGKYHVYWRVADVPLDEFTPIQTALASHFGGDPKVKDLPRVLRLPGFWHMKDPDHPHMTRLLECHPELPPYTLNDILGMLPEPSAPEPEPQPAKPRQNAPKGSGKGKVARCQSYIGTMLDAVSGSGGHDATLAMACECARFDLSEGEAAEVMTWVNSTKCVPPWSESELQHKIASAYAKVGADGDIGTRNRTLPGKAGSSAKDDGDRVIKDPRPMRMAELFLDRLHGGRGTGLRLRRWASSWWQWSDGAYREIPLETLMGNLARFLDGLFTMDPKSEELVPVRNSVTSRREVEAVLAAVGALVEGDAPMWLDGRTDPRPAETIAFRDRIYHLPSGETYPATPTYFSHTALPFDYTEERPPCPAWLAFLQEVFDGDGETIQTLRNWFGYLLTPDLRHEKILFLLGPKRSGKGTIARVLRHLVGLHNVSGPTLSGLGTNFGLAGLIGKTAAIIDDARLSGKADQAVISERLLSISGQGLLTVDRKFRDSVEVVIPARLMILSNDLPRFSDPSGALAGRFVILRIIKSWYGREDHKLFDRLKAELPGILAWSIDGWRDLQERGYFHTPARSADLVDELEALGNPVGAFLSACTKEESGPLLPMGELFDAWCAWCKTQGRGDHTGSVQTFGRDLRAARPALVVKSVRVGAARVRCIEGISLC